MDRIAFVRHLGAVVEDAPWVAHEAWAAGPFADVGALHAGMVSVMRRAAPERRLQLIRAHPDLAGSGALGPAAASEQRAAGLGALAGDELAQLRELNAAYRTRFGFPFVICAREHTAATILAAARERVARDPATEEDAALTEIAKIARLRLAELVT
jgi:OHCU decarboxylase